MKLFFKNLTAILLFTPLFLQSQSSMPLFVGWEDDNHFLIEKSKGEDEKQTLKVNAKTGKETVYERKQEESFSSMMPEGYSAGRWNSHIAADGDQIVFVQENDLYHFTKSGKKIRQLTSNGAEEQNPYFSPDGKKIAFTRDGNLFVIELETGLEKQLTTDGSEMITNGWASWVYYEEILGRSSRYRCFYWSPNSDKIAFLRFDDTPVPEFPIFHHEGEDPVHGYLEMTSYPKSGDPNPLVELGIADIGSGKLTWVEKNKELEYLAWVIWAPDGKQLTYQQLTRDQDLLEIYKADPATGASTKIYEESQKTWVDWFEEIYFLKDNNGFILRSNKDGWFNLYHYSMDGGLVAQITNNDWRVSDVVKIDEENNRVFFEGTGENPTESHFFVVDLKGKNQKQLTSAAGTHGISLSPDGNYFVDEFSSYDTPGILEVFDTKGKMLLNLGKESFDANKEKGLKVEFFTIPTEDGFDLPATWVLPPNFDESKKYPVIFSIYGGPDAGTVYNSYRNYSWNPLLSEGVIRIAVDHRASGKFGKKGLDYMHRSLGKWEMHDYIEAVKWLREKPFIDSNRIGIQGSSYGGYMAAMALTYASDYFTHGIAGLSVTDWRLYDNVYTERYMDEPKDNPEGYEFGSVMTHAENLKGRLLITHGTIDDNVHMQNSMQLISRLQDLGKDFEMMFYPGGRHGWGGAKGRHNWELGLKFWRSSFFGDKGKP